MNNTLAGLNNGYLPPQHVPTVKDEDAVKKLRMYANSDVLIMNDSEPIVYLCATDSLGNLSYEAFDLVKRKTKEQLQQEQQDQLSRALLLMNERLERLEAKYNESFTTKNTQQQSNAEFAADQSVVENPYICREPSGFN